MTKHQLPAEIQQHLSAAQNLLNAMYDAIASIALPTQPRGPQLVLTTIQRVLEHLEWIQENVQ